MNDWIDLKKYFVKQNISAGDIKLINEFLKALPFRHRQRMMGIFMEWPEKNRFFIGILKEKIKLAQNYDAESAGKILTAEEAAINEFIKK